MKVRTRQPAKQSCHTFASSINLVEDNDEMNVGETLERPIGKKAENRQNGDEELKLSERETEQ